MRGIERARRAGRDAGDQAPGDRDGRAARARSRAALALAGLGCLAAVVLLGVAVGPRATGPDRHVERLLREPLHERPYRRAVRILASETAWPHAAYAMALAPLAAATALAAADLLRHAPPRQRRIRWPWLAALALAVPAQHLLRVAFDRTGPGMPWWSDGGRGAYPSGAALGVAIGWAAAVVVAWDLRPRWRAAAVAAGAAALGLHALARVAAEKHWATDIAGAYLLVAGVLALAAACSPARG